MRKEKIRRPAITICSVLQGSWLHCERIKEEEEEGSNFLGLLFGPGLQNYQKGQYHIYITIALAWHYASSALLNASKSCSKLSVCLSNHSLVGLPVLPNKGSEDHTVFLRYQYRVRCTSVSNMSNLCTSMPNASPSILAILQSFSNCLSVTVYWRLSPMVAPVGRGGSIAITTVLV